MNITHSFGKRSIQMDEKIVMTRRDLERIKVEARIDELGELMSSKMMSKAWFPELDRYYDDRIDNLQLSLAKGKV